MKIMCSFCHNLTNDKPSQSGKGKAGANPGLADSKFVPFTPRHIAKKRQY